MDTRPPLLDYEPSDGGRKSAGFDGRAGDCACRAIAIASGRPYREVYDELNLWCGRYRKLFVRATAASAENGLWDAIAARYLTEHGWSSSYVWGTVGIRDLPRVGPVVVLVPGHFVAVVDGCYYDTFPSLCTGRRRVDAYWQPGMYRPVATAESTR
jgi:hypothetical protein